MGTKVLKALADPRNEETLRHVYKSLDKNGDGVLSREEWKKFAEELYKDPQKYGIPPGPPKQMPSRKKALSKSEFVDYIFNLANPQHNPKGITFEEFRRFCRRYGTKPPNAGSAELKLRLVATGELGVGRTTLLNHLATKPIPTPDLDYLEGTIVVKYPDDLEIKLQLCRDPTPNQRFRTLDTEGDCWINCHIAVIMFDITNLESFKGAETWAVSVERRCSYAHGIVVGNKTDLDQERVVSLEQGQEFAKAHGWKYCEMSAKTGEGIDCIWKAFAKELMMIHLDDDTDLLKDKEYTEKFFENPTELIPHNF